MLHNSAKYWKPDTRNRHVTDDPYSNKVDKHRQLHFCHWNVSCGVRPHQSSRAYIVQQIFFRHLLWGEHQGKEHFNYQVAALSYSAHDDQDHWQLRADLQQCAHSNKRSVLQKQKISKLHWFQVRFQITLWGFGAEQENDWRANKNLGKESECVRVGTFTIAGHPIEHLHPRDRACPALHQILPVKEARLPLTKRIRSFLLPYHSQQCLRFGIKERRRCTN